MGWVFAFTSAAYNLVRLRTLILAGVSMSGNMLLCDAPSPVQRAL